MKFAKLQAGLRAGAKPAQPRSPRMSIGVHRRPSVVLFRGFPVIP